MRKLLPGNWQAARASVVKRNRFAKGAKQRAIICLSFFQRGMVHACHQRRMVCWRTLRRTATRQPLACCLLYTRNCGVLKARRIPWPDTSTRRPCARSLPAVGTAREDCLAGPAPLRWHGRYFDAPAFGGACAQESGRKARGRTTNWTTPLETAICSSALRPTNPRPFVGLPPVQAPTKCEETKRQHSLFQQATARFIFALGKNSQVS
jgi:hypothetical protein